MTATDEPTSPFWTKRWFQIPARICMAGQVLLLLIFGIDLLTRTLIPYSTIVWLGVSQGVILILLGVVYWCWPQIIWPVIGRWEFTHRAVSKLGALGLICLGLAVSLWFFFREQGLSPFNARYSLALALVILGLILGSFGVRRGRMNARNGSQS